MTEKNNLTTEDTPVDSEWFEIYINRCSFDDIQFLKFDQENLQKQKELFFAGEIDEPTLLYQDFQEQIAGYRCELESFLKMIEIDRSQLFPVRRIYHNKICEQLDKIALLEAMYMADNKKFLDRSLKIYGELDKGLIQSAISTLLVTAKSNNHVVSDYLLELADYFGASEKGSVIEYVQLDEDKEILSADKIAEVFKEDLKNKGIPWQVNICDESLVTHVSYSDNTINIPTSRRMTRIEAEALVEHEVNVHLVRYVNGNNSKLRLLSIGLDGYIKGEEGIATYRQCLIDKNLPSVDTYIYVGLASGLYDGEARSFREIYNFSKQCFQIVKKPEVETDGLAWKTTLRMFRGTTGKAGACFTRGSIYFEGFMRIRNLIETNDSEVSRFMVGKYDPANPQHTKLLDELNIR